MSGLVRAFTLTVNAIDLGGCIVLVDRQGQQLGRRLTRSEVEGKLVPSLLDDWPAYVATLPRLGPWDLAAIRAAAKFASRNALRRRTGWLQKADTLSKCLKLRARSTPLEPTGKTHSDSYSTTTWVQAKRRLWTQLNNRYRKNRRTGWERWASTVSNRFNKKKGCRYAPNVNETRRDQSEPDHVVDRATVLPVRPDRPGTHSGDRLD